MIIDEEKYLAHYGILRKSGRYPWGSGGTQSARNKMFLDTVADLRKQGLTESQIVEGLGLDSITQLRAAKTIARNQQKQAQITQAQRLQAKGMSNVAAAERMGIPESSYRALLAPGVKDRNDILLSTADALKKEVDEKKFIDVGSGVEAHLGVSQTKLDAATALLKEQGYSVHPVKIRQVGTGKDTNTKVLVPPGVTQKEVFLNRDKIQQIATFSDDGGYRYGKIHPPIAIDPKRVAVRYKEDGGADADGVIYVRPGVDDISLGKSNYAQVRVKVGDSHFLKGMAMYKDDLPAGTDLVFNTNKERSANKLDVMKELKPDQDYPFGSVVRQILKDPGSPNERVTSAMNIVYEEGNWADWKKTISSQVLSKQSPSLAREQLAKLYDRRKAEFDEINSLTNPTVKRKLLESYADTADRSAVHLSAAHLPRQGWHAILPIDTMPESQIYAPNYRNGESVALIRYPHAGIFEIPILTVNNKQRDAKKFLGAARDAVGIHHTVAERLSGADFDGDTVLVIPNGSGKIKTSPALEGLKNFDPRTTYKKYEGMPVMSDKRKQQEMGDISNLITDMTIRGAPHSDLARAVRHSMVVIDAQKHELNYKQSAVDNGIKQLKQVYQGGSRAGASTLISRAGSRIDVPARKPRPQSEGGPVDPITGRKMYVPTNEMRRNKKGELEPVRQRSKKLAETDDAFTLVSDAKTPIEKIYATHSNKLKALANQARLSALNTPRLKYSASANKAYAKEVASLDSKLKLVQQNRPRERQAQIIANANIRAIRAANPNLDGDSLKRVKFKEQEIARIRTGARRKDIKITPEEWDAIQAGAIHENKLSQILTKADLDVVRKLATPRSAKLMTTLKTQRAETMLRSGYTRAEVADLLGVSLTTLDTAVDGGE